MEEQMKRLDERLKKVVTVYQGSAENGVSGSGLAFDVGPYSGWDRG
jgi:hypothetical protein